MFYGLDAQDSQAFGNAPTGAPTGWDNSWDFGSHGWALPQLYVQFANSDWDIKVGKFYSPFGYEVVAATGNFFYSRSFTMYNSEPFTMTGILTEKQISSTQSMILGATAGWDTAFENNQGGNLIVGTRIKPNDWTDLALTSSIGDTGFRGTGNTSSAVGQFQLTDSLQYVFQGDFIGLEDVDEFGADPLSVPGHQSLPDTGVPDWSGGKVTNFSPAPALRTTSQWVPIIGPLPT